LPEVLLLENCRKDGEYESDDDEEVENDDDDVAFSSSFSDDDTMPARCR
jgi:hypothetical protein